MVNLAEKRAEIANYAKSLGFGVDAMDCDAAFDYGNSKQSQYITVRIDLGKDADGYEQKGAFVVRISDHYQVKSCGSKADLCSFSDGEEAIKKALQAIISNPLPLIECDMEAREYVA